MYDQTLRRTHVIEQRRRGIGTLPEVHSDVCDVSLPTTEGCQGVTSDSLSPGVNVGHEEMVGKVRGNWA